MKVDLNPWIVPNFVIGKMPPGRRQDGFNPDAAPKWALSDVDAETLAAQCDQFRAEVFRKAGKPDPANAGLEPRGNRVGSESLLADSGGAM